MSVVAHFFMSVGGSEIHERLAHFFIDFYIDIDALSKGSLYEYLKLIYNFTVDQATETFRPVMPTSDESTLLQVSTGTPCILLERFSYEQNILIEYTKSIVRGDKYIFRVELRN